MSSYALITGASKGIGKSIAVALASRKYHLLLIARSADELQQLADQLRAQYRIQVAYLALDLSQPGAAQQIHDWLHQQAYPVSILVNNAGYGLWGNFATLALADQSNMLQLNMQVVVELTYCLIPLLKKHPQAYILNVASTAAYQAVPTLSLYAASKAFVLSFTRGLRFELKDEQISVTCLCPGPVNTNFVDRAGMSAIKATAEKFGMHPDAVAEVAVKGMLNRKAEIIPGFLNALSASAPRFLPKSWLEKIAAGLYKNK